MENSSWGLKALCQVDVQLDLITSHFTFVEQNIPREASEDLAGWN